jgi:FkbM family methyltransferase
VHAFEPNPALCEMLSQTLERNAAWNVRLHPYGLGSEAGRLPLTIPEGNAGMGSLAHKHYAGLCVEVAIRPLLDVVAEFGIGRVRLVKIDVEGFEVAVLQGARTWLLSSPPDVILYELNRNVPDFWADPATVLLGEAGYDLYAIPKRLFGVRPKRIDPGVDRAPASNDFLAVHRNRSDEIMTLLEH